MEEIIKTEEDVVRYLQHEMSASEQAEFEQRLQQDPELAHSLKEYTALFEGVEYWGDEQLRKAIKKESATFYAHQQTQSSGISPKVLRYVKLAIAAATIIGLTTFWFKWNTSSPTINHNQVIAQYFKPEAQYIDSYIEKYNSAGIIDAYPTTDPAAKALILYKKGDYNASIQAINLLTSQAQKQNDIQFYLALNYMAIGDYVSAETIFQLLCSNKAFELFDDACWYYGLALISQQNKTKKAVNQFELIAANKASAHFLNARKVLDQIK